jgi:hypothetical protein
MKLEKVEKTYNSYGGAREGAGRKAKEKMYADLNLSEKRKIFYSMVSEEDFRIIVMNYLDQAKKSPQQAEFIINQLIGKPMQAVEVTGKNGRDLIPVDRALDILRLYSSGSMQT